MSYKNTIHFISGKKLIVTLDDNLSLYFRGPNISDRTYYIEGNTDKMISGLAIEYITTQKLKEVEE